MFLHRHVSIAHTLSMGILFIKQVILVIMVVCLPKHFLDKRPVKEINTFSFQTIAISCKKQLIINVSKMFK